jgi:hypothetical protein
VFPRTCLSQVDLIHTYPTFLMHKLSAPQTSNCYYYSDTVSCITITCNLAHALAC